MKNHDFNHFHAFFLFGFMMLFFVKMVQENIVLHENQQKLAQPPILPETPSLADYQQWDNYVSQFSHSPLMQAKSTNWRDEKGHDVMVFLNYFHKKLVSATIRQSDSTPPSWVTYRFHEGVVYQAELLIGEINLSHTGEKWVRFNQKHGVYWFDKKGKIIHADLRLPFSAQHLPLRYAHCAICVKEAQIIWTHFPIEWTHSAARPVVHLPENAE